MNTSSRNELNEDRNRDDCYINADVHNFLETSLSMDASIPILLDDNGIQQLNPKTLIEHESLSDAAEANEDSLSCISNGVQAASFCSEQSFLLRHIDYEADQSKNCGDENLMDELNEGTESKIDIRLNANNIVAEGSVQRHSQRNLSDIPHGTHDVVYSIFGILLVSFHLLPNHLQGSIWTWLRHYQARMLKTERTDSIVLSQNQSEAFNAEISDENIDISAQESDIEEFSTGHVSEGGGDDSSDYSTSYTIGIIRSPWNTIASHNDMDIHSLSEETESGSEFSDRRSTSDVLEIGKLYTHDENEYNFPQETSVKTMRRLSHPENELHYDSNLSYYQNDYWRSRRLPSVSEYDPVSEEEEMGMSNYQSFEIDVSSFVEASPSSFSVSRLDDSVCYSDNKFEHIESFITPIKRLHERCNYQADTQSDMKIGSPTINDDHPSNEPQNSESIENVIRIDERHSEFEGTQRMRNIKHLTLASLSILSLVVIIFSMKIAALKQRNSDDTYSVRPSANITDTRSSCGGVNRPCDDPNSICVDSQCVISPIIYLHAFYCQVNGTKDNCPSDDENVTYKCVADPHDSCWVLYNMLNDGIDGMISDNRHGSGDIGCTGVCIPLKKSSDNLNKSPNDIESSTSLLYECGGPSELQCADTTEGVSICVDDETDNCDPQTSGSNVRCPGICIDLK